MGSIKKIFILFVLIPVGSGSARIHADSPWGFDVHRKIVQIAIYSLPHSLSGFYLNSADKLIEYSTKPDQRRYASPDEAARHYIDLDLYPEDIYRFGFPEEEVVDSLLGVSFKNEHGSVPWTIREYIFKLTYAFKRKNRSGIIRLSAELCHYIADSQVPLHTTSNYNGQFTGQHGIHSLWETRLPELFISEYDLFCGQAEYLSQPDSILHSRLLSAHALVDDVLQTEIELQKHFGTGIKYSFNGTSRVVSQEYATEYHRLLNGMVERQIKTSIELTADIWFTCWVNAGMPSL